MQRRDFERGLEHLCNGFRQSLTAERTEALWDALQSWPASLWDRVVQRALGGSRWPDLDRLESIASNYQGERAEHQRAEQARKRPDPGEMNEHYGRFRMQLHGEVMAGRLQPAGLADELSAHADMFPMHAAMMRYEIDRLRAATGWGDLSIGRERIEQLAPVASRAAQTPASQPVT